MSAYGMTKRQQQLLNFITSYVAQHSYSPTFEEMKVAVGLASKSGVHRLVSGLEERGLIRRLPYRDRSIIVNPDAPVDQGISA